MGLAVDDVLVEVGLTEEEGLVAGSDICLTLNPRLVVDLHVLQALRGFEVRHVE